MYARDWALANKDLLAQYAAAHLADTWSGPAFRLSLLGLTLVVLVLAFFAARAPRCSAGIYLLLGVLAVFAANALFPHLAVAIALQAYVPGVVTAIALVLPAATWVYISTLRDGYATRRGGFMAAAAGIALYAAIVSLAIAL